MPTLQEGLVGIGLADPIPEKKQVVIYRTDLNILDKQVSTWDKLKKQTSEFINRFKETEGIKGTLSFFNTQLTTIGISFE